MLHLNGSLGSEHNKGSCCPRQPAKWPRHHYSQWRVPSYWGARGEKVIDVPTRPAGWEPAPRDALAAHV